MAAYRKVRLRVPEMRAGDIVHLDQRYYQLVGWQRAGEIVVNGSEYARVDATGRLLSVTLQRVNVDFSPASDKPITAIINETQVLQVEVPIAP